MKLIYLFLSSAQKRPCILRDFVPRGVFGNPGGGGPQVTVICMNIDVWKTSRSYTKNALKCEDQQEYKAMIEAALFSTPEECINNSPMTPNPSVYTKNSSARKSICQFTETLDVKHDNSVRRSVQLQ